MILARPRRMPGFVIGSLVAVASAAVPLAVALASPMPPSSATTGASPTPAPAPREADRIIRALESHHAAGGSLSASFTQTYRSAATNQQVVERGRLFIKRPGRMRWDYRQPDKKVFLVNADGSTLSYAPADYTAVRGRIPPDAPQLQLLLATGDILDSFAVAQVQLKTPVFPGSRQLKLTPRKPTDGVEVVYLELDARQDVVQRVLVVDPLGNESDLVLEKVNEDGALKDEVFDLQLPPGIAVRDSTTSGH